MINAIFEQAIRFMEHKSGESADWMRGIARTSKLAVIKFGMFIPLASHRPVCPAEVVHVARLAAVRHEDCGPCLQTVVNQALAEGVAPDIVQTVIDGKISALSPMLADIHRFTMGVVVPQHYDEQLRQSLVTRLGEAAMVEVALAIATVRVFPTVKRALGHGLSCALVKVHVTRV